MTRVILYLVDLEARCIISSGKSWQEVDLGIEAGFFETPTVEDVISSIEKNLSIRSELEWFVFCNSFTWEYLPKILNLVKNNKCKSFFALDWPSVRDLVLGDELSADENNEKLVEKLGSYIEQKFPLHEKNKAAGNSGSVSKPLSTLDNKLLEPEVLVSYLPALYARVFNQIGPADLTILCGNVKPVEIPSPYPEPSELTVKVLQREFRQLPIELQKKIVYFTVSIPHLKSLKPRREMQDLILELGGEF